MVSSGNVIGVEYSHDTIKDLYLDPCDACMRGKMTKLPAYTTVQTFSIPNFNPQSRKVHRIPVWKEQHFTLQLLFEMPHQLLNGKWKLLETIGKGSFGKVYLAEGKFGQKVAVKFEDHKVSRPLLKNEYLTYRKLEGCRGFSKVRMPSCWSSLLFKCSLIEQVHDFCQVGEQDVMVMDLLGPSLKELFKQCNHSFSLKTTLQLADQMLERIEIMHSKLIVHCDIKPANFVIGLGNHANTIYCIDFGLSRSYYDLKTKKHIPFKEDRNFVGTPRYASINAHLHGPKTRRDDLESIGYLFVYFLKGSLPWQGIKCADKKKTKEEILKVKQSTSLSSLCHGLPREFREYLKYTRKLKYDEKPNIPLLRKMFHDLYVSSKCADIPQQWDWDPTILADNAVVPSTLFKQRQGSTKPWKEWMLKELFLWEGRGLEAD